MRNFSAAGPRCSSLRLARTTVAPVRTSSWAMAKPIPVPPPVMMPTRPSKVFVGSIRPLSDELFCKIVRMRRIVALGMIVSLALACAKHESKPKPLSVPGEKLYTLKGTIVARDAGDNTLRVDPLEIPRYMEAMTMDYSVRGADVLTLPPDMTPIEAKLHVVN